MKQKFIRRISNGESVDLSRLNKTKLIRLHYEEEKYVAHKLLGTKPFSNERTELMCRGYNLVNAIMAWYLPQTRVSYGANEQSVDLVCNILTNNNGRQLVFEAGVETGFSCERFLDLQNVSVRGCDILVSDKVKQLERDHRNISVDEDTLYNSLKKMPCNSIDCFYADNVIEHLMKDEFSSTINLLGSKMKKGGRIILFIPNSKVGPADVSKYFVRQGRQAQGFHFMEMTYGETIERLADYGMLPKYVTWRDRKYNIHLIADKSGKLNKLKIWVEFLCDRLVKDTEKKRNLFYKLALTCYVFEKV